MKEKTEQEQLKLSTKQDQQVLSVLSSFVLDLIYQQSSSIVIYEDQPTDKQSLHLLEIIKKQEDFDVKLLVIANQKRMQVKGAYLYTSFLEKLQQRQKILKESINYILTHKPQKDCNMKLSMLYLCYINYYCFKHHQRKLNNQFDIDQLQMIRTNSQYCKEKMFIQINYKELEWGFYDKKIELLKILQKRVVGKRKELEIVLTMIGPNLHLFKKEDMVNELKVVIKKMWENNVEEYYSQVSLQTIMQSFRIFVHRNKVEIKPSVQELIIIFQT